MGGEDALKKRAPHAHVILLQPRPPDGYANHASQFLIEQLAPLPAINSAVEQMVRSINLRGIGTGRSHDGFVLVHPGSGSREKCWPTERFVKVIDKLKRTKKEVRVVVGEVESERFTPEQIASLEKAAGAPVFRPATFVDLFNELRIASLLIGNDSGPSHLAGVMGLPTVTLFGPSDPVVWKPMGPRVRVLHKPTLDAIGVDDVMGEVKAHEGGA
jgi:ADP-heptose:LPS heptosyltransferase